MIGCLTGVFRLSKIKLPGRRASFFVAVKDDRASNCYLNKVDALRALKEMR